MKKSKILSRIMRIMIVGLIAISPFIGNIDSVSARTRELTKFIINGEIGRDYYVADYFEFEYSGSDYGRNHRWTHPITGEVEYSTIMDLRDLPEGEYVQFIEAQHHKFPAWDNGFFYTLTIRSNPVVSVNKPVNPGSSDFLVGRDINDTFGEVNIELSKWEIRDDNNNVMLSGQYNVPPTQDQIDSLPAGNYTISNTIHENVIAEYGDGTVFNTVEAEFSIIEGSLSVSYIEIDTEDNIVEDGLSIIDPLLTERTGKEYVTVPKDIPGYTLVKDSGNTSGVYTEGQTDVVYYYIKNEIPKSSTTITVHHVDDNGNILSTKEVLEGYEGDSYTTNPQQIPGYEIKTIPVNNNGVHSEEPTEVVYVYSLISPIINDVIEKDNVITGSGTPGMQVEVTLPNGEIIVADIDEQGKWEVDVPEYIIINREDIVTAVTIDPKFGTNSTKSTNDTVIVAGSEESTEPENKPNPEPEDKPNLEPESKPNPEPENKPNSDLGSNSNTLPNTGANTLPNTGLTDNLIIYAAALIISGMVVRLMNNKKRL